MKTSTKLQKLVFSAMSIFGGAFLLALVIKIQHPRFSIAVENNFFALLFVAFGSLCASLFFISCISRYFENRDEINNACKCVSGLEKEVPKQNFQSISMTQEEISKLHDAGFDFCQGSGVCYCVNTGSFTRPMPVEKISDK